jgi:glycosyltransferase involved in cell wall biosynthesis
MRIITVLNSLGMGGAEKQALAVAERMMTRGHAVAVLVLRPRVAEEWPSPVEPVHLGVRRTPVSVLAGLRLAYRFLRDFQPDVVNSHSFHANMFARLLRLRMPSLRVISTIHNTYERSWSRMMAYRLTNGLACRTVAVSKAAGQRFVSLARLSERKCIVIPNGFDTVAFVRDPERRVRTRSAMGLSQAAANRDFIWLAAGRITPAKDYPNLLRAFALVHASQSDSRLWIAGEGKSADLKRLQVLSGQLNLGNSVRWLGLRRDMPALLDAADGFVSASAWEGMPLAVGEAMAMEKLVVATDVGGVRELVGDAGVLVPARDFDALAKAMLAVMERSREEREHLARSARERILRHFSMDAAADAWEALYRDLLP